MPPGGDTYDHLCSYGSLWENNPLPPDLCENVGDEFMGSVTHFVSYWIRNNSIL